MKVIVLLNLLLVRASGLECSDCADQDETSLLQVSNAVKLGTDRADTAKSQETGNHLSQGDQFPPMPMQGAQGGMMPPMPPMGMPMPGAPMAGGLPTAEQFGEMLQQAPQNSMPTDPGSLQVTGVALPQDLMPRGIHPGATVPGLPQQDGNAQFAANPMAQMMGQPPLPGMAGMAPQGTPAGMPGMVPFAGAMPGAAPPAAPDAQAPQVLIQPGPNGMATIIPLNLPASSNLQEEDEESDEEEEAGLSEQNVEEVVDKVMNVLGTKKATVTDSVVDRVVEVLGAKKKAEEAQMKAAQKAQQDRLAKMKAFTQAVEKNMYPKVEEKVRAKVEAKVRQEFEAERAKKKKKHTVREQTLSELAAAEEDAAEKAAALNTESEQREKEIAKAAAEKAAAEKVAAAAQKAVAQAASRTAAAQRAAAAAEKVVAKLNKRTHIR